MLSFYLSGPHFEHRDNCHQRSWFSSRWYPEIISVPIYISSFTIFFIHSSIDLSIFFFENIYLRFFKGLGRWLGILCHCLQRSLYLSYFNFFFFFFFCFLFCFVSSEEPDAMDGTLGSRNSSIEWRSSAFERHLVAWRHTVETNWNFPTWIFTNERPFFCFVFKSPNLSIYRIRNSLHNDVILNVDG